MSDIAELPMPKDMGVPEEGTTSVDSAVEEKEKTRTVTVEVSNPTTSTAIEGQVPFIVMPPETTGRFKEFLANTNSTAPNARWVDGLKSGLELTYAGGELDTSSEQENTLWRQTLKAEDKELGIAKPRFDDAHSAKLAGEAALLRIRDLTGMGTTLQVPLYHSGFWISIKAPDESELLELDRKIAEIKVNIGRNTRGRIFSNMTVALSGYLVDFVLAHTFKTTIKTEEVEKAGGLRKIILQQDLPIMLWGIMCLVYPNGFNYTRSLIKNDREEIVTRKLNLARLCFVNNRAFTDKQLRHFARRFDSSMTLSDLEEYQNSFIELKPKEVKITDEISVIFSPSKLIEYLEEGQFWIDSIVSRADKILNFQQNSQERDQYYIEQGKASIACQYNHIVEKFVINGSQVIDDRETIHNTLALLSSKDEFMKKFFEEAANYLKTTVLAMIALPSIDKDEDIAAEENNPAFPHLIPLDLIQTFFTLLVQTLNRIQERE